MPSNRPDSVDLGRKQAESWQRNAERWTAAVREGRIASRRAGTDAADAIESAARGQSLSALLRERSEQVAREVFEPFPRELRWHFMRMG